MAQPVWWTDGYLCSVKYFLSLALADNKFSYFPRKYGLTFHTNCLPGDNFHEMSSSRIYVLGKKSLKYHIPNTWHDIPPSHILLTPGWPVLALLSKCWALSERAASTIFTSLVWLSWGSNPQPPDHKVDTLPIEPLCWSFCVEVLLPSQPNGVKSSMVSLPNYTFTGQT